MKQNKKTAISVLLDESDYEKLKRLSEMESRTMASYLRNAINTNYANLSPLEKQIIKNKEEVRA
ncbi:MAG: hypothetical protein E7H39_18150 [Clostridium sp.]|nr:hypothetical protein [Clostridium sp.]